jgi:Arsenical resistance operon protein ArsD
MAGTVQLYDPPMCCSTGLCGPGVDPRLLQVARDVRWLQARGVRVDRFGLSQEPQAFVANARIAGLLQAFGDDALPAVVVNDRILVHGRYPTRDELAAALTAAPAGGDDACCDRGSGCW